MENQHRKIVGYRELSQQEIDLINRIKSKGAELIALQVESRTMLCQALTDRYSAVENAVTSDEEHAAKAELARFQAAESFRWSNIGKTDIQTGIMALIRAVAQPAV